MDEDNPENEFTFFDPENESKAHISLSIYSKTGDTTAYSLATHDHAIRENMQVQNILLLPLYQKQVIIHTSTLKPFRVQQIPIYTRLILSLKKAIMYTILP